MDSPTKQVVLDELAEALPQAFSEPPRPLKLEDLLEADLPFSEDDRRDALKTWVRRHGYLRSLIAGTPRIDLQGELAGYVRQEEELHGQRTLELKRMKKKRAKKRKKAAWSTNAGKTVNQISC